MFGRKLRAARERAGLTQSQVGEWFGITGQAVSQWERGETMPETDKVAVLATKLDVSERWLLNWNDPGPDSAIVEHLESLVAPKLTRVVGYVGAGASAHYYPPGDLDTVPSPDGSTDDTVAVEIRGDSLGSIFDRWIVFYDDVRRPVTPDLLGQLCVVGLVDGRILIKKIRRGKRGLYTLLSEREPPIEDADIEWAAKVKNMVPR